MSVKEVVVYQASKHRSKKLLIILSNGLCLLALLGLLFTFGPLLRAELNYQFKKEKNNNPLIKINFNDLINATSSSSLAILSPNPYFSLVIPKIDARAKIIANTDAANKREYLAVLKRGVAHAKGTVFPGMKGATYLFAHSTDAPWHLAHYNAVFYLLNKLEKGDEIIIFFQGKKFFYLVEEKRIIELINTDFFKQEEEILILQTCYPPGTSKKALAVFAKRKSS